jgi:hypothetical protein
LIELHQPSLIEELSVVTDILAEIDAVAKHSSPILVIQRWVRGHNARKRFKAIRELRFDDDDDDDDDDGVNKSR